MNKTTTLLRARLAADMHEAVRGKRLPDRWVQFPGGPVAAEVVPGRFDRGAIVWVAVPGRKGYWGTVNSETRDGSKVYVARRRGGQGDLVAKAFVTELVDD